MPQNEWIALMGMGGGFVLLGIVTMIWGRHEENSYYNSMSTRGDQREFLEHWPPRPQLAALKIGGRIALAIGLVLLVIGGGLRIWP